MWAYKKNKNKNKTALCFQLSQEPVGMGKYNFLSSTTIRKTRARFFFKCGSINKHKPNLKLVTEMKTEITTVCAVSMPQE